MVVAGAELAERHFPNSQLRAVGGVSGGHGARLAERLSELSNTGGWWGRRWLPRAKRQRSDNLFQILDLGWRLGTMVVDQSEASAERLDLNFGVVAGGDGGIECGWSAGGGKAPAAYRGTG